jgi:LEA14-like dessication related protein
MKKPTQGTFWQLFGYVALFGLAALSACSSLGSLAGQAGVERPQVAFTAARLTGLSFDRVDLQFDVTITNPNPLGVKLAGFRYDLSVNENTFLQGTEEQEVVIAARGESTVPIPLTLSFDHLYKTFQSLRQEDATTYLLQCAFLFDLPVIGTVELPASKGGDFPLPKIPAIDIQGIQVEQMSPLGAELVLGIAVDNPNAFSMILEGMQYQFEVNGLSWASGETGRRINIAEKGDGLVQIPISLDFVTMGASIYALLTEERPLDYQLQGDLDISSSLPLLGRTHIPFDRSGQTEVFK